MYVSLFAGGGALARDVTIGRSQHRSFWEFLDGDVEIATGRITGRQALKQIATIAISLVLGGSAIVVVADLARTGIATPRDRSTSLDSAAVQKYGSSCR
jgi:hypothetical protein